MPKTKTEPKTIIESATAEYHLIQSAMMEYYNTKQKIANLEDNLKSIQETLKNALKACPEQKAEIPGIAKFTLVHTITYKYSDDVSLLEKDVKTRTDKFQESIAEDVENIKALKKQEEKSKVAEIVDEKFTPRMTPIKE